MALEHPVSSTPAAGRGTMGRLASQRGAIAGLVVLGTLVVLALGAPWLNARDPIKTSVRDALQPPGPRFVLGSDQFGRDVASRVLHGARISLTVGLIAVSIATVLGAPIGLVAGYYGGWLDAVLMRATDVVMAFPSLVLAIGLIAVFEEPGLDKVFLVLGALGWTTIARVIRGEVLTLRGQEYVEAARAVGVPDPVILVRHVLPNCLGPLLVAATIGVGGNMVAEAGLSFLGLGAQPPTISWGAMLAEGQTFLTAAPWVAVFPGGALLLAVLGVNLLGDGLRDLLDPRFRKW